MLAPSECWRYPLAARCGDRRRRDRQGPTGRRPRALPLGLPGGCGATRGGCGVERRRVVAIVHWSGTSRNVELHIAQWVEHGRLRISGRRGQAVAQVASVRKSPAGWWLLALGPAHAFPRATGQEAGRGPLFGYQSRSFSVIIEGRQTTGSLLSVAGSKPWSDQLWGGAWLRSGCRSSERRRRSPRHNGPGLAHAFAVGDDAFRGPLYIRGVAGEIPAANPYWIGLTGAARICSPVARRRVGSGPLLVVPRTCCVQRSARDEGPPGSIGSRDSVLSVGAGETCTTRYRSFA